MAQRFIGCAQALSFLVFLPSLALLLQGCGSGNNGNTTTTTTAWNFCSVVHGELGGCGCQPGNKQGNGVLDCDVHMSLPFYNDTFGVKIDFEPCGAPAKLGLDITESDLGIDFPIENVKSGDDKHIAVPGVSVKIPDVPVGAGLYADVKLNGDAEDLTVSVGLDLCADIPVIGVECASKLPGVGYLLPVIVFSGNWSFGSICGKAPVFKAQVGTNHSDSKELVV